MTVVVGISKLAQSLLDDASFVCLQERVEVELVKISVADLGFPKGGYYRVICDRAAEQGLLLCPPDVGPALRLVWLDQPSNEAVIIASKPLGSSTADFRCLFQLDHNSLSLALSGLSYPQNGFIGNSPLGSVLVVEDNPEVGEVAV